MELVRFAASAMATRFELVLEAQESAGPRALADEVFEELRRREACWSAFEPSSVVARLNREASTGWVAVDEETFLLLAEARRVFEESGGAFDATVGALMEGFALRGEGARGEAARDELKTPWGCGDLLLDEGRRRVRFARSGLRLDLGGIAKGRALDLAVELLRDHGVERALIHGGTSTVVGLGAPLGEPAWRVALGPGPAAPVALLHDSALAVSRALSRRGPDGGHLIDPRHGRPLARESTAAVVAPRASTADAWSTALCVAGEACPALPAELAALRRAGAADASWRPLSAELGAFQFPAASRPPESLQRA